MATPSGISVLGDLEPGAHIGQFYWDEHDLVETLVPFFASGLRQQERCVWVCSAPLCAAEARRALAQVVPDLADREHNNQIAIVDHEDWYVRRRHMSPEQVIQGWIDAEQEALAGGYRALRINDNMFWLQPEQWQELADYEAQAHTAFRGHQIIALCSYSLSKCGAEQVVDVLHNHSASLVPSAAGWNVMQGATAALATLDSDRERIDFHHMRDQHHELAIGGAVTADDIDRMRAELAQVTRALAREIAQHRVVEAAYASAREAREHLVLLNGLTAALGEVTTRAQLADLVRDLVAPALDAAAIVLLETDAQQPLLVGGIATEALARAALAPPLRAHWSTDVAELADAPPQLRAYALVPVSVGARRLATLALGFAAQRELATTYRAVVEDVARQLALALDRAVSYERLEQERQRAELASRAKDEFLAMLGHELRNPLSPILTATQLMRLRSEDVFDKERTVIERQCKHMIRLVDDLLDVSRITRGKIECAAGRSRFRRSSPRPSSSRAQRSRSAHTA